MKLIYILAFCFLSQSGCLSSGRIHSDSEKTNDIRVQVICDQFDEVFNYPTPLSEKKDLLTVLAELSVKENPSIRFISTNQTAEIMEINGRTNTWREGWMIYVNGEKLTPYELKRGIRVSHENKIEIKLETVERVFGKPTKHD